MPQGVAARTLSGWRAGGLVPRTLTLRFGQPPGYLPLGHSAVSSNPLPRSPSGTRAVGAVKPGRKSRRRPGTPPRPVGPALSEGSKVMADTPATHAPDY